VLLRHTETVRAFALWQTDCQRRVWNWQIFLPHHSGAVPCAELAGFSTLSFGCGGADRAASPLSGKAQNRGQFSALPLPLS